MQRGPANARRGPRALLTHCMNLVAARSNLEPDRSRIAHPVVLSFEEAIEEARLQGQCIRRVVSRPFASAVRVKEAVFRADAAEGLEAAARVHALIREARADERRDLDALERRCARCPEVVPLRVRDLLRAQRLRHPTGALRHVCPEGEEAILADAAGVRDVAVDVGEPFPGTDGYQGLRAKGRDLPLADGEVRHTV